VARLAPSLAATSTQRLRPVGPGGRPAEASPTTPPKPSPAPPTSSPNQVAKHPPG